MAADLESLFIDLLRDELSQIAVAERGRAIAAALERYSEDAPRKVVAEVTADGSTTLPLPAGWVAGRSKLQGVEYPVGEFPPRALPSTDHGLVDTPDGQSLRLLYALPVGAAVWVHHTALHDLASVPEHHALPVAQFAAALCLDQLAGLAALNSDSTISADSVDHKSQALEYTKRARALREQYFSGVAATPAAGVAPASAVSNWNGFDSLGRDRTTHPGRYR